MIRFFLLWGIVLMGPSLHAANYEYKVYFGLSKSGGAVSLAEWEKYEAEFSENFPGFSVIPAVGFYKGTKERSRIVTLLMDECQEPSLTKEIRRYVHLFSQDSVLVSKSTLVSAEFIGAVGSKPLGDTCAEK